MVMAQRKREERGRERKEERERDRQEPASPVAKEAPSTAALPISLVVSAAAQDLAGRVHLSQTLMNQLLLQAGDLLLLQAATAASEVIISSGSPLVLTSLGRPVCRSSSMACTRRYACTA